MALPPELAAETVVRLRGNTTSTDGHGNTLIDWTTPDQLPIEGCSVQPMPGDEYLLGRESVTSRWRWRGPEDADIRSSDRIRHRGIDYEIDGSVQDWTDPVSVLDHRFCFLTRIEG